MAKTKSFVDSGTGQCMFLNCRSKQNKFRAHRHRVIDLGPYDKGSHDQGSNDIVLND